MKEYLIEVKRHHDSLVIDLRPEMGARHFQEFVQKFNVKNYVDLSYSFVRLLNGLMDVDEFIDKVKVHQ